MTRPTCPGRRWLRATVATLTGATLAVTGGLLVVPSTGAQASAAGGSALPARYTGQEPAWQPCDRDAAGLECATIEAPLDYRRPDGPTITVAISRLSASAPARRRGILLLNPGGPGEEGLNWPDVMRGKLPKGVTEQYDLIGFDPRGIGRSDAVSCPALPSDVGSGPEHFAEQVAAVRAYATACLRADPAVAHISTRNTARDMDLIRAVLGERKLSYFGLSYGTYLGAVYTQLFPHRADRIVLDSAIDPALVWYRIGQMRAVGTEAAFERWTVWTAERDATYHLGGTPEAVRKRFRDLVAKANSTPIEVDGDAYTGDGIRDRMEFEVVFVQRAAELVAALSRAAQEPSAAVSRPSADDPQQPELEPAGGTAILCNDARWPRDPETYRRDALRLMKRYPLNGYESSSIMPCAFWENPYAEPRTRVRNDVGALIVQNEWDWSTPARNAYGLHRALRGSRLLLVDEGEGHIAYGQGSSCADEVVNTYLTTGRLPARDVTCPAAPPTQETPSGR